MPMPFAVTISYQLLFYYITLLPESFVNQHRTNHYTRLGVTPWASEIEIRRQYRELSKRYHPDTTELPLDVAKGKFQELNEAYATLSNPKRRSLYDLKIGYSPFNVIEAPADEEKYPSSNSAYLDPIERPLSGGEIFVLFILGVTFLGCLILIVVLGLSRSDTIS